MSVPSGEAAEVVSEPGSEDPSRRLPSVVRRLSITNALPLAVGLITGPLQARALGASGRGDLAAILVPVGLAPLLLSLGLGQYAGVNAARRARLGPIVG